MNRTGLQLICFCLSAFLPAPRETVSAAHYSVLINEFLPDPDPVVGLPGYSFIELKNVSGAPLSLQGWAIGNGKTKSTIKKELVLAPDSLLILCTGSAEEAYAAYGNSLGLSGFPVISHVSGEIILTGPDDEVIDAVAYSRAGFKDAIKAEGGWSLERIDPARPCLGDENWMASTNPAGGSPGKENAVRKNEPADSETSASFIRAVCPDSLHVLLWLDGPLDPESATDPSRFGIMPAAAISAVNASPPFFDQLLITLREPLKQDQIYQVSATGLTGCGTIVPATVLRAGLPAEADSGAVLFNEILFNPEPYGSDYLELYHAGKKIIDLQNCQLASRDQTGTLKDPRPVSAVPWLLFPGDYLVVCEDRNWVQSHYLVKAPGQLIETAQLPSMPDDRGDIVLVNSAGGTIDELPYSHGWHSPLIADESGVALEKTGVSLSSASGKNWTSAAGSAGFGTPTYVNSELAGPDTAGHRSVVSLSPAIFSPDNDGYNDFCFVSLNPGIPGFTAHISVYDINGINIRSLASGISLAAQAGFRWDGTDDSGRPLPSGRYLIFTELFSLQGTVRHFRNTVVLARKR